MSRHASLRLVPLDHACRPRMSCRAHRYLPLVLRHCACVVVAAAVAALVASSNLVVVAAVADVVAVCFQIHCASEVVA